MHCLRRPGSSLSLTLLSGISAVCKKQAVLLPTAHANIKNLNLCSLYLLPLRHTTLCETNIQPIPLGLTAFDTSALPVTEAAAEPPNDLCDFVKQLHQHGVPVSTSRTDAPWVAELHREVGAPVIRLIKYALTSAAPETLETCGALGRPAAGGVSESRMCCGK